MIGFEPPTAARGTRDGALTSTESDRPVPWSGSWDEPGQVEAARAIGARLYSSWVGGRKTLTRINRLITEAARDPGIGSGKPERLSGDLTGSWSRRIDQEHRLGLHRQERRTRDRPGPLPLLTSYQRPAAQPQLHAEQDGPAPYAHSGR